MILDSQEPMQQATIPQEPLGMLDQLLCRRAIPRRNVSPQEGIVSDAQPVTDGGFAYPEGSGDVRIIENVPGMLTEQSDKLPVAIPIKIGKQDTDVSQ